MVIPGEPGEVGRCGTERSAEVRKAEALERIAAAMESHAKSAEWMATAFDQLVHALLTGGLLVEKRVETRTERREVKGDG